MNSRNDSTTVHSLAEGVQRMECVEIYIPKNLEHLSELYNYLRRKLNERASGTDSSSSIDGFSLYEVDGAFAGGKVYQERTLVIRILFKCNEQDDPRALQSRIETLGREIATTVVLDQEEVWICHYPQSAMIFRPLH